MPRTLAMMPIAYLILMLVMAAIPEAFASGNVAPKAIEVGIAECSDNNLNTFICAREIERKALADQGKPITRSGDTLSIAIQNNTISLVDNHKDGVDSTILYSYLGYDRKLDSHILYLQYYEGGAYMVIHHHSGHQAFTSGFPLASPDGKHFLSLSEDMFAGYSPNNVEVWQVVSGEFSRVSNYKPEWGPRSARWATAGRALVEKQCYAPTENNPAGLKPCGVARVERSGSTWVLIE
ncbi:hypothetical protein ED236_07590 [Pseudomethylobacillus aquaticus]|uniref:Uncharacterized protein n=1 Tax=Pseudomethylobacillus aquaticus TaxID=2676064 RepID=A0A3N0V0K4_9PROT|nr:hypothetical protein [Pseudomethylobacillus aquaticus]ROH86290.1 hypothetical protein ED236_07590 [Pseudomethylobacillus aquaticus]